MAVSECPTVCPFWRDKTVLTLLGFAFVLGGIALWKHYLLLNEYQLRDALMGVAQDSASAFALVDETGRVTAWSKGAENLFGTTAEQAVGGDMSPYIPPAMRAIHRKQFAKAVERGGVTNEKTIITCDAIGKWGKPIPVVITIRSVPHQQGLLFLAEINRAEQVRQADLTAVAKAGGGE
jgi:PAS domain S-box-containing protein